MQIFVSVVQRLYCYYKEIHLFCPLFSSQSLETFPVVHVVRIFLGKKRKIWGGKVFHKKAPKKSLEAYNSNTYPTRRFFHRIASGGE